MNESARRDRRGCSRAAGPATPGGLLRRERERRGYSVQQAAEDLHLDAWVVEALEANRFDVLGAPVYAKGHLRKYATLLGLSPATVLAALRSAQRHAGEPTPMPVATRRRCRRASQRAEAGRCGSLAAIAVAAGRRVARRTNCWPTCGGPMSTTSEVPAVTVAAADAERASRSQQVERQRRASRARRPRTEAPAAAAGRRAAAGRSARAPASSARRRGPRSTTRPASA